MSSPFPIAHLRQQLDTLARRGERRRLRHQLALSIRQAGAWWPVWVGAGPLVVVSVKAFRALAGLATRPVDASTLLLLALAGPITMVAAAAVRTVIQHRRNREAALSLFERTNEPGDRLRCADDFLRAPILEGTSLEAGFMRAALAQHVPAVASALAREPVAPSGKSPVPPKARWLGLPAAAAVALLCQLEFDGAARASAQPKLAGAEASVAERSAESTSRREHAMVARAPSPPEPLADSSAPRRSAARQQSRDEDQPSLEQSSGSGSQSTASTAAASAASKATPQKPAQASPDTPPPDNAAELAKPEAPRNPPKSRTTETVQLSAQADSGHGRSPSSSSSPSSPFDPPELPDRAGALADRDVEEEGQEDEDEQQKAEQSGLPLRSEQMADVGRDLNPITPPPGPDREDPPTMRGGPGDIKKSRGVPSMVLGIPIPDRIPGVPGAGRTKVTQEFAEPTPESHPQIAAQMHATRNGRAGVVQRPELTAWRRQLLERYFQFPRSTAGSPAIAGEPADAQ
jgi:hypothetical protein